MTRPVAGSDGCPDPELRGRSAWHPDGAMATKVGPTIRRVAQLSFLAMLPLVAACTSLTSEGPSAAGTNASGAFGAAGSMKQPRTSHTATLLLDGRVLVVGGESRGGRAIARAEVWDTTTRSWRNAGSLARGRVNHTATLLPDGRVLVVGGNDDAGLIAGAEIWDLLSGTWRKVGRMARGRELHSATLLPDGRVLIVGGGADGRSSALARAEVWSPDSRRFRQAGSLARGRIDHSATLLPDGRVLVMGGRTGNGRLLGSAEVWDPATASFSLAGSLAQARLGHSVTALSDGRVLVVGGNGSRDTLFAPFEPFAVAEVWDPERATFSPAGSLAVARSGHTATMLPDGRVLIAGGDGPFDPGSLDLLVVALIGPRGSERAEVWDPMTTSFTEAGSLDEQRRGHTATLLPDGRVLVLGGCCGGDGSTAGLAEIWNPARGTFERTGALEQPREHHTVTLLPDGRVLVAGGEDLPRVFAAAEMWDPAADADLSD